MSLTLIMFYKISKITDNATHLKGCPVPHFSMTEVCLRASFLRYSFIAGQIPWDEEQLQWCFGAHQSGLYKYRRPIYSCMVSCLYLVFKYSRTSTQRPSWGQRKVAIVERRLLWGGREVIWHIFFREYKYSRPIYNLYVSYQCCSIQMEARLVVVLIESLVSFIYVTTWFTLEK